MKKDIIIILSIPIAFAVGIVAFFILFPLESLNLQIFIDYMASLSTVIMVLVYIITT